MKHLAVLVGNLPGSPTAVAQPSWAKLFNRQFPLWVLWTFAPSMLVRLVAGLPKGFAMSRENTRVVSEFIDSLFPVSPRGVDFDAFVSNADVNDYTLEAITVPNLDHPHQGRPDGIARGESARRWSHPRRAVCQPRIGGASHARSNEEHPRRTRRFLCHAEERRAEAVAS